MASARVSVKRDGGRAEVELSTDLSVLTIGGRRFAVRVVSDSAGRVELDVEGTTVVLTEWPAACATPPGPVTVDGESWEVELERSAAEPGFPRGSLGRAGPSVSAPVPSVAPPPLGTAILPPMPGRVVEVRVREGEAVEKGTVLLVLEAMKMRNEIVAPRSGVVRELKVREGSNVRARETMLLLGES